MRSRQAGEVGVMHPDCYREIRFPGYEGWNAVWDMHAAGPFVYIPLCAEFPVAKSVVLFRYDTRDGNRVMICDADTVAGIDLSTGVMPQSKFHTAIQTLQDGRLFMVTHNTAPGIYHPTWAIHALWHDPTGFSSRAFIYDPRTNITTYVGTPVPNEDFYFGRVDAELNRYYACGYRTGTLYVLDLATLQAAEVANHPVQIAIVVDGDHMVYTTDSKLRIWQWNPFRKRSTMTPLRMPCSPYQKEPRGSVVYMWKDPDGWIYAVGQYADRMCRFKPNANRMEDLGNGLRDDPEFPGTELTFSPVRAPNGKLYYGVLQEAVGRGLMDGTEIVEFDPETKVKRNLGTMVSSDGTNACSLGEGVLGADGKIYWGDGNHSQRPAMMWVFDPSRVPPDFTPVRYVPRKVRAGDLPDRLDIRFPEQRKHLYRFHPLVTQIRNMTFETNPACNPAMVRSISLVDHGLDLYQNAVIGLTVTGNGALYGVAGSDSFKLFRLLQNRTLEILAVIPATRALLNGNVLAAHDDAVFCAGDAVFRWTPTTGLTPFAELEAGQRPVALAVDGTNGRLFVLAEPANVLHVLDLASGRFIQRIELGGYVCSRWIKATPRGWLYGFEANAGICKIAPDLQKVALPGKVPCLRGTEFIAECTSLSDPVGGVIWGGTREGCLFSIAMSDDKVTHHGKPGNSYLKGVTVLGGRVFCFSGGDFGNTHLHSFCPSEGFHDFGMTTHKLVNAAVAGTDGILYAGEYSSASDLLMLTIN